MRYSEPAPAKLNLALHVRGRLPDGRHALETVFAFCTDGDILHAEKADDCLVELHLQGPFAGQLAGQPNIVSDAYWALRERVGTIGGTRFTLDKRLPVASGIGGGSADAAAALRLLTRLWGVDPAEAAAVAPQLGSDVPACLISKSMTGTGAGDQLQLIEDAEIAGRPVLLVNPLVPLSTANVFARWDGTDRGSLGDWRDGRNDLETPARSLVPAIDEVLAWLRDLAGSEFVRMSGSGATCFALFASEDARDSAAEACPSDWWHLATFLR